MDPARSQMTAQPADAAEQAAVEVVPTQAGLAAFQPAAMLDPKKRQLARDLAFGLDLSDSTAVATFGSDAQRRNVERVTEPMLARTLNKDSGEAGNLLAALITQAQTMEPGKDNGNAISRLFGRAKDTVLVIRERYTTVAKEMERIQGQLEGHERQLTSDIRFYDALFGLNAALREDLIVYICAGKLAAERARKALEAKKAQALASPSDYALAQEVQELQSQLDRIERKTFELYQAFHISVQTGPKIRIIQSGDEMLREMLTGSIFTVIPLWKMQVAIAIGINNQQKALEAQRAVTNATTKLIVDSARMVQANARDIAVESGRGIVDMEALAQANQMLIAAVTDAAKINEENRQKRLAAEAEMQKQQQELAGVLAQVPSSPKLGAGTSN